MVADVEVDGVRIGARLGSGTATWTVHRMLPDGDEEDLSDVVLARRPPSSALAVFVAAGSLAAGSRYAVHVEVVVPWVGGAIAKSGAVSLSTASCPSSGVVNVWPSVGVASITR